VDVRSVKVGMLEIAYRETGAGDPVVLLNGTGESGGTWLAQTGALEERYRCIAVDQRDTGYSSYVEIPYTPADMASDAAGLIDELGLGASHVIGYSLGGAAAQELALARPDLVRSLVLLSTWARSDDWFKAEMRSWIALRERHWNDEEAFLDALLVWVFSPATYATPGLIDGYKTMAAAREPTQRQDGFVRQCLADIAHDAEGRLPSLDVPTLVIVGEDDICTTPRYARRLAELIPKARLVTIPGVAHGALWERPDVVNDAILGFFAAG
jgi:pimeloyl-ACP methyl ester carboxylesterase